MTPLPRVERDRVSIKIVVWSAIGFVVFAGISPFIARAFLDTFARGEPLYTQAPEHAPATIGIIEQTPILSTRRGLDFDAERRALLTKWGWVDRDKKIARIPIDRAMDLVAAPSHDGGT